MVRIHPDPPDSSPRGRDSRTGAVAQLGERLLCKQEVVGSIPSSSTRLPRRRSVTDLPLVSIGCGAREAALKRWTLQEESSA
jgi:hypothetical protein